MMFTSCSVLKHPQLEIDIPDGFCGHVYVIQTSIDGDDPVVNVDKNGIGYMQKQTLKKKRDALVMKAGEEITDSCRQFYTSVYLTDDGQRFQFAHVYVPCPDEMNQGEEYWRDKRQKEVVSPMIRELMHKGMINIPPK